LRKSATPCKHQSDLFRLLLLLLLPPPEVVDVIASVGLQQMHFLARST
jgi:hypothetical protein